MEAIVGVVGIVSAAIGGAISYLITANRERTNTTMEQYRYYHSQHLHGARARVARFLDDEEAGITFNKLWRNPETMELYEDMWQVTYFWFGLLMLTRQRHIDRKLAEELFSYHYEYWQPRLHGIAVAALAEHEEDPSALLPEWVPIMSTDFMPWLRSDR